MAPGQPMGQTASKQEGSFGLLAQKIPTILYSCKPIGPCPGRTPPVDPRRPHDLA